MAAPNVFAASSIFGKTVGYAVTNSIASTGVSNAAASNKVLKVGSVTAANISANPATVSVTVYKNQTTDFYAAYQVSIPVGASLVLVGRDYNPIYLEENDSLRAVASANNAIQLIVVYEEIS